MLWDEIDVEKPIGDAEIAKRIAPALGLAPKQVEVVSDAGAKPFPSGIEARIEATRSEGQFPLRLGIYFAGNSGPDRESARTAIGRSLGARILVSDGGVNPYTRIAIDPEGHRTAVKLDVEALDERDQVRIDDRFVLKSSTGAEAKLDPARSLVVGRSVEGGFRVNDIALSKRHFALRFSEGSWVVEDLESTSGTYVNDKIARGPTPLSRGDRIRAGSTVFTLS